MATNKYDNQFKKKFSELEKQLNKIENRINNIVNSFLSKPELSKKYWSAVNRNLNAEYQKAKKLTDAWASTQLPKQYRFVLREQMAKARKLKSISNEAQKTITQLLKSQNVVQIQQVLAQSAIADITSGLLQGRNDINKLIAATRQTLIAESAIDTALMSAIEAGDASFSKILSRQNTIANKLLKANDGGRYIKIIDKNGNPRRYKITDYSELVYRTKWHEAQSAAVRTNNANYDTDLIRVSSHNTTTEICQQYEGKIFSLTGKNKDFPIADQVPPYHVNCLHYITTTFAEALQVQGVYNQYADFSKNKINVPPGQSGFVPIKERNKIANETIADTKNTIKYKNSTAKQKRNLIRNNVSKAIGKAA